MSPFEAFSHWDTHKQIKMCFFHTRSCKVWRRIVPSKAWIHFSRSSASRAEGENTDTPSEPWVTHACTHTLTLKIRTRCTFAAHVTQMGQHEYCWRRAKYVEYSSLYRQCYWKREDDVMSQKTCDTHKRLRQDRNFILSMLQVGKQSQKHCLITDTTQQIVFVTWQDSCCLATLVNEKTTES